ncbi:hypothetical protein B0H14DRAFT_3447289 [Mycena olivaceomarginata]|nr:hypothetical protein B0H14DRAFT_3447289 [Mycena olivaceomarginata]
MDNLPDQSWARPPPPFAPSPPLIPVSEVPHAIPQKCRSLPRSRPARALPIRAHDLTPRPRHRLFPCALTSLTTPAHFPNPHRRPLRCPSALATATRQHLPLPAPPRAPPRCPSYPLLSRRCVLSARPSRLAPSRVLPRPSRPASTCACSAPPSPSRHAGPAALQLHRGRAFFPQAHPRPLRPYRSTFLSSPPPFPLIYPFPNPFASLSRASTSPAPPLHKLLRRRYFISRAFRTARSLLGTVSNSHRV